MKGWMAAAFFMLITAGVMASPVRTMEPDSLNGPEIKKLPVVRLADTVASEEISVVSPGVLYRDRLDSIQETVPLTYNKYVQDYIDIYMSRSEQIGRVLGLSAYYFPIYEKAFKENNIPEEVKFVSIVESSLNPFAVSRVGATGLWQFMYATAKEYGLTINNYVDERKDPVSASYAAARYFREAFDEFGDWLLAIAAYNCGTKAVEKAIDRAGGIKDFWTVRPYLPLETRNYIPAFIATNYIMKYYAEHDISPVPADLPAAPEVIQVNRFVSLSSIAKAIELDVKKLTLLNPSYKKQIINGTQEAPKALVLPALKKSVYADLYTALNTSVPKAEVVRASGPSYHRVKNGENLSVIAERYHVKVRDLKAWNKLKTLVIHPGQLLRVSS